MSHPALVHLRLATPAGIGPEIADAVQKIFSAAEVPITWDVQEIGKEVDPRTNSFVTRENLDSVLVRRGPRGRRHRVLPPGECQGSAATLLAWSAATAA